MAIQLNSTDVQWKQLRVAEATSISTNFTKLGYTVASDAVEAATTDTVLVATGHVAVVGDQIIMTSGGEDGEGREVISIATNTITLDSALSGTPAATETFSIVRPIRQSSEVGAKMVMMANNTNQSIDLSYDGTELHDRMIAASSRSQDYKSNNLHLPKGHETDTSKGWVSIRATSTQPTSGEFTFASAE